MVAECFCLQQKCTEAPTIKTPIMKLAIVTAYPPSKVTLNEYAYHLVKHFRQHGEVTEVVLLTDVMPEEADVTFEEDGCNVSVVPCWRFNSYTNVFSIAKAVRQVQPDAILYNLQFMKFGDKKIPAALQGILENKSIQFVRLTRRAQSRPFCLISTT